MAFASIPDAANDIREGRMIIIVDDEDRENEGDLVCAAETISADKINFMATHARGLICLPLTEERCDELHLSPQVADNTSRLGTAFTVSIEARRGVTTGISAAVALSEKVLRGQSGAVEAYLGFLKSGGSRFPLETLKAAGVDKVRSQYLIPSPILILIPVLILLLIPLLPA